MLVCGVWSGICLGLKRKSLQKYCLDVTCGTDAKSLPRSVSIEKEEENVEERSVVQIPNWGNGVHRNLAVQVNANVLEAHPPLWNSKSVIYYYLNPISSPVLLCHLKETTDLIGPRR